MRGTLTFSVYLLGCVFLGFYYARVKHALPPISFVIFAVTYLLGVRYIAMQFGLWLEGRYPSDATDAEAD